MKSLIRLVIICAFLSTFAQAILSVPHLQKPEGPIETEDPKEPEGSKESEESKESEGPKGTNSPFHFQRMAMVVSEVAQSPNWNSLSDDEKKMVARFLFEMVSYTPKFSPFGG